MNVWVVEIKTRAEGGGWWGKPLCSHLDLRPILGPPERLDIDNVFWWGTGNPNIYVTAQLRDL